MSLKNIGGHHISPAGIAGVQPWALKLNGLYTLKTGTKITYSAGAEVIIWDVTPEQVLAELFGTKGAKEP